MIDAAVELGDVVVLVGPNAQLEKLERRDEWRLGIGCSCNTQWPIDNL